MSAGLCIGELGRIAAPSREDFRARYLRRREPIVLRGAASVWPATSKWSLKALAARFHDRRVYVQQLDANHVTRYESGKRRQIAFGEFCVGLQATPPAPYYLVLANMLTSKSWLARFESPMFPELMADVNVPDLVPLSRVFEMNLWIGSAGTTSNLHFDPFDNLLAVVSGRKCVRIFSPNQSRRTHLDSALAAQNPLHSPIDVMADSSDRYPEAAGLRYRTAVLEPGDILYMPAGYWHHVVTEETSIAVNVWWRDSRRLLEQFGTPLRRNTLWFIKQKLMPRARKLGDAGAR